MSGLPLSDLNKETTYLLTYCNLTLNRVHLTYRKIDSHISRVVS